MQEENVGEENIEDNAKLEAKVRREVMRLLIEEAKLEAEARARSKPAPEREAEIINISPKEEQLELDLDMLQSRAKLEESIRKKTNGIVRRIAASCAIIILVVMAALNLPKWLVAHYDLFEIKNSLQRATSYYGQFKVEEVMLSGERSSATLNLGFSPATERDLKNFVESLVERYLMARPGERIDLLLKKDQRIYAKASYTPRTNSIDIELMK